MPAGLGLNSNDNDSSGVSSRGGGSVRRSSAISGASEDELGPLPEGWEERLHSDGRIFFIDHSQLKIYA